MHAPEDGRHLTMLAKGVGQPRDADEPGVRGDEQDGGGEDADPRHEDGLEPAQVVGQEAHDPDDRILLVDAPEERAVDLVYFCHRGRTPLARESARG